MRHFFIYSLFYLTLSTTGTAQVISLKGHWKFHLGDKSIWSGTKFDDSDWEEIKAPAPWEDEGFNGYDGFAWYRKKFDGRALQADENYYLNLGFIDDTDEVYVNGQLIGSSGSMPPHFKTSYNSERKYALPSDIVNFKGDNMIAIRVFDVVLGGGIIDGTLGIYKKPNNGMVVDLQGLWSFTTTHDEQRVSDDREWKNIMVPSPWEQQGLGRYDGFAWYKKTFTLKDKQLESGEDYMLILGKIDDFDKTYLNGRLIGQTNDGRELGSSRSFEKLRAYPIPNYLLKRGSPNTIEVLVEDIGNIGGIYEGPVGIATKTAFYKRFRD